MGRFKVDDEYSFPDSEAFKFYHNCCKNMSPDEIRELIDKKDNMFLQGLKESKEDSKQSFNFAMSGRIEPANVDFYKHYKAIEKQFEDWLNL